MLHEVYICYSIYDRQLTDAICSILEDNGFRCWIKPRDLSIEEDVAEIISAIKSSRLMLVVFSENAKYSNYVRAEVDIAFSSGIPIIIYKIDDSRIDGGFELFLDNKHCLEAYPDLSGKFNQLVIDVGRILGRPVSNPVINSHLLDAFGYIIEEDEKSYFKKGFALSFTCIVPILIVAFSLSIVDFARSMFLLSLAGLLFIGTPILYVLYNHLNR